jgi:hypothetical protein
VRIWKGEALTREDQAFWDVSRSQVPNWALFQRMKVSADDLVAQCDAKRKAEEIYQILFTVADEVSITEKDGVQSFTARFKVKKEPRAVAKKQSWWQRISHHWRFLL